MKKSRLQKYIETRLEKYPQLADQFEEILEVYSECVADNDDEKLEYMAGKDAVNETIKEYKATHKTGE